MNPQEARNILAKFIGKEVIITTRDDPFTLTGFIKQLKKETYIVYNEELCVSYERYYSGLKTIVEVEK